MILYHTSNIEILKPSLEYSRPRLDFGKGFYLTPIREQALDQLQYKKPNHQICITSQYTLDKYLHFQSSKRL